MQTDNNQNIIKSTNPLNQDEIQMYLKDIRKIKVMTPERERQLSEIICSGACSTKQQEEIHQELLEGNLRFVITVAKQYQNQGLDLSDLIAEGNFGLMKAIKNFDWTKKLRFISYAVWWIKQSILQSLNENSRTIRLPVNVVQELQKAKKEVENNGQDLPDKFASLHYTINYDAPLNEEGDTLLDVIKNPDAVLHDAIFDTKEMLKEKLFGIMNILDERERVIIEDYFGLSGK